MTNTLHFSEWRICIRAQRKANLCAPGAPKGPKVGMSVRQYEILCSNDAGALLGNTLFYLYKCRRTRPRHAFSLTLISEQVLLRSPSVRLVLIINSGYVTHQIRNMCVPIPAIFHDGKKTVTK